MIPDSPLALLAIRAALADQLMGARIDDPVVEEVERPVAPRTRTWLAGALHAAAVRVAPHAPAPTAR